MWGFADPLTHLPLRILLITFITANERGKSGKETEQLKVNILALRLTICSTLPLTYIKTDSQNLTSSSRWRVDNVEGISSTLVQYKALLERKFQSGAYTFAQSCWQDRENLLLALSRQKVMHHKDTDVQKVPHPCTVHIPVVSFVLFPTKPSKWN